MPPHPLTNFEIKRYCQDEPKFNGVYLGNNLPKIKKGAYVRNLDEYESLGTVRESNNVTYFDSFGQEHIPKEIKRFIGNRNIKR